MSSTFIFFACTCLVSEGENNEVYKQLDLTPEVSSYTMTEHSCKVSSQVLSQLSAVSYRVLDVH